MNETAEIIRDFCIGNELVYLNEYKAASVDTPCVALQTDEPLKTLAELCDYVRDCNLDSAAEALGDIRLADVSLSGPAHLHINILYFPSVSE